MQIDRVSGKRLEEVIYKKSEGEGIVMVCVPIARLVYDIT